MQDPISPVTPTYPYQHPHPNQQPQQPPHPNHSPSSPPNSNATSPTSSNSSTPNPTPQPPTHQPPPTPPPLELDAPISAIVLNATEMPQWLRDIEKQLECPICAEVSASGYVRLECDCYICAACASNVTKYAIDVSTNYTDPALVSVRLDPFPCPRCRTASNLEPNLIVGNRRCDSNFLCMRSIYQSLRPNHEYLRCNCATGRHDNDNAWINCSSRLSTCSWCKQPIALYGTTSLDALKCVYQHLAEHCTHRFECRYCHLVDHGAWRQLSFTYPSLITHCKVHRMAFNLLHHTRDMLYALYPQPHTFNSDVMQFWVCHAFSLVHVFEVESRQTMFSDASCGSSSRSNAIRRQIANLIGHPSPNTYTRELAPSFYEFILNNKWVRQDCPLNVMEVLPALMRLVYQDQEPRAITDPEYLQAFVTEASHTPPPERNVIFDSSPPIPPPLPPPFRISDPRSTMLIRLPSLLTRLGAADRPGLLREGDEELVESYTRLENQAQAVRHMFDQMFDINQDIDAE